MAKRLVEDENRQKGESEDDAFMRVMRKRSGEAFGFETEQRQRAIQDMKFAFVSGHQWDDHLTQKRRNRPCYEFNRTRQSIRAVTGQQLKNKPQIKVRPAEETDVDLSDVLNGLIKNIENQSHAEVAYDTAFQWSCGGGYGVIRVVTEYESDYSFDQCLKIKTVYDPMTVFFDPTSKEFDRRDARYVFVTEMIPRAEFKKRWPDKDIVDFDSPEIFGEWRYWYERDEVRIAEYWYKEEKTKTIYLLSDGTVVDAEEFDPIADEQANPPIDPKTGQPTMPPLTIQGQREVKYDCVKMALVSGKEQLEEAVEWPGTMIPIVPQWGDILTVEGRQIFSGMTRFMVDSQRIHNFELSTMVEVMAKLPNSPLMATAKHIEGYKSYYERMGYDDPPVLLYNADPDAPGGPQRQPIGQFPSGFAQGAAIATEEMKATSGVYDASLGATSNETSGRAILARQNQGETANFVYIDNQVKALKRIGEILVDAIPKVYDADRSIRILGEDGGQKFIRVNRVTLDQQTGREVIINDLTRGKYDVVVTVGKSFDTARMEVAEAAQALSQTPGPLGFMAQYLLLNNLDVPGMDEYKRAARKVLVAQGLLEAGENDQPPPPQQPDPAAMADAENKMASARKSNAQAEGQELENQANAIKLGLGMGELGMRASNEVPPMGGTAPAGMPGSIV